MQTPLFDRTHSSTYQHRYRFTISPKVWHWSSVEGVVPDSRSNYIHLYGWRDHDSARQPTAVLRWCVRSENMEENRYILRNVACDWESESWEHQVTPRAKRTHPPLNSSFYFIVEKWYKTSERTASARLKLQVTNHHTDALRAAAAAFLQAWIFLLRFHNNVNLKLFFPLKGGFWKSMWGQAN